MNDLKSLLKLKPFIGKYKLLLICAILSMLLNSIISIPIPYIIGKIINDVFLGNKNLIEFNFYILVIAILYILKYLISIISSYLSTKFNTLISNELKIALIDKVISLPMSYLGNIEKGYLQGRIAECDSISSIFSVTIMGTLFSVITAGLSISTMFLINYKLAILVLALIPLFFIIAKASNNKLTSTTKKMLEASAFSNSEGFEIINGIEDIKILNGKGYSLGKFKSKLNEFIKISLRQNKIRIILTKNITIANDFGTLLILIIAGILIIKGQFNVGLYTTFSLYSDKVFSSSKLLANIGPSLKQSCLSIDRVFEIMNMEDENKGKLHNLDKKIESIKFENITFKYKNNYNNVLESLNFEIKKGEKVLISGENGSGKSTLIKLLLGLYKPSEGKIIYNNKDLSLINKEKLRNRIGIVSQNIFLFKGTVLENILYGQSEKKRKDVEKIIMKLNLKNYISRLPRGLDSQIIQNNNGISGGQAQVIAFIRAMLVDKDIIILDEPIANVDTETRNIILRILKENYFDGILIIISHFIDEIDFIDKTIKISKV